MPGTEPPASSWSIIRRRISERDDQNKLVGKQTLYEAAMSATSRILGLSLANYL